MKELTGIRGKSVEAAYKRARDLLKDMPLALESLDELEELATSGSEAAGGKVVVDLGFARGIEYYTGMIFEVSVRGLNLAVAGGGRYDGLCSLFGADLPAVGMALGVDRLVLGEEFEQIAQPPPVATVMILDPKSQGYGLRVAKELRAGGIPTTLDLSMGSLSSRMEKVAGREFRFAILVGQKEAAESKVTVRDMKTGTQEMIPLGDTIRLIERASREG